MGALREKMMHTKEGRRALRQAERRYRRREFWDNVTHPTSGMVLVSYAIVLIVTLVVATTWKAVA